MAIDELQDLLAVQEEAAPAGLAWDAMRNFRGAQSRRMPIEVRDTWPCDNGPVMQVRFVSDITRPPRLAASPRDEAAQDVKRHATTCRRPGQRKKSFSPARAIFERAAFLFADSKRPQLKGNGELGPR
ncbi:hypothetical protein [Bradyrhizobium sp. CCBAU 11386]|uniref:hypothetical protein n=1 Tax=Bradyrhizobium sp. CCBAU 11386 TaxID=1630837 RepID=UPI0023030331|nr:hypothetical protein [Bradyrhizobium sp. CCBAU 11386]